MGTLQELVTVCAEHLDAVERQHSVRHRYIELLEQWRSTDAKCQVAEKREALDSYLAGQREFLDETRIDQPQYEWMRHVLAGNVFEAGAPIALEMHGPVQQFVHDVGGLSALWNRETPGLEQQIQTIQDYLRGLTKRKQSPRVIPLNDVLHFKSDLVNLAVVRSISQQAQWFMKHGSRFGLSQQHELQDGKSKVTIGYPPDPRMNELWRSLGEVGALAIQAHYALWARWYQDNGGNAHATVTITPNQFCSDLGFAKHKHGGYHADQKRRAVKVLESLMHLEMAMEYQPPRGEPLRLRGSLWKLHTSEDELVSVNEMDTWDPISITYSPGPWFYNERWAEFNSAVGNMRGLLRLSADKDKWAIYIGGYIGTLMRTTGYQSKKLKIETILIRTDLAQEPDVRRRATATRERFDRAMDRLVEVEVIKDWTPLGVDVTELSDADYYDQDKVSAYVNADPNPPQSWRQQVIEVSFAQVADAERLKVARHKAVAAEKRTRKGPAQKGKK